MIANKHITAIVAVIVAASVMLCVCGMMFSDKLTESLGSGNVKMEYETKLFDTSKIISIDIIMEESEWNDMLENATSEEYHQCDVKVNGTTFYGVGIRPKGNTSLSAIASDPDNDRYSFKLEFDYYADGQTCFGLDKLVLNNNYADATNMKEAVIYDMYSYLGADASLYNYADISVNGSYWGVYLALEAVEDSFALRNYGVQSGELYKPDSMDFGGGEGGRAMKQSDGDSKGSPPEDFDASQFSGSLPEDFDPSQFSGSLPKDFDPSQFSGSMPKDFDPSQMGGTTPLNGQDGSKSDSDTGKGGGFSMGGNGANLEYTDDELDSYSTIWDGSVTKTSDSDHKRVVTALKNISEGTDLEKYLDVDNILKYMAVHSFAVNEDSLSGSMAHNYYLYEYNGQLNILPWDYNLSFGGMGMGGGSDASSVINDPIDTPFSGTTFFDALLENEEYLAKYHEYYRQLVEKYVDGGEFDSFFSGLHTQIDSLVKTDPNAMYTYEEYEAAADMLYKTVKLRAESIEGQLDGNIPSTSEGQKDDSSALIDASEIDIKSMGTFSMGGGNGAFGKSNENTKDSASEQNEGETEAEPDGKTSATPAISTQVQKNDSAAATESSQSSGQSEDVKSGEQSGAGQFPSPSGATGAVSGNGNQIWMLVSIAVLIAALVFAMIYRRKAKRR